MSSGPESPEYLEAEGFSAREVINRGIDGLDMPPEPITVEEVSVGRVATGGIYAPPKHRKVAGTVGRIADTLAITPEISQPEPFPSQSHPSEIVPRPISNGGYLRRITSVPGNRKIYR